MSKRSFRIVKYKYN